MVKKFLQKTIAGLTALAMIGSYASAKANAKEINIGNKQNSQLEEKLFEIPQSSFLESNQNYKKQLENINFKDAENSIEAPYLNLKKKSSPNYISDALQIAAGFATQYGVHELGHYLGGKAAGTNIKFDGVNGKWDFENNPSNNKKRITLASGFILPRVLSEALLDIPQVPKNNSYVLGLISGPIIHDLWYIISDATGIKKKKHNDFEEMSKAGLKREVTYPILLGISALQTYRLIKNPQAKEKFKFWVNGLKGNGLMAGISYKF